MHAIPVDLILHDLSQRLRELPEEKHHALAKALTSYCINHCDLAGQWCNGAGVAQQAAWLVRRLEGEAHAPQIAHETRALEVAIARRLSDSGLSLLITQDTNDGIDAVTLLEAAHRVVGLSSTEVHTNDTASWESRIAALEGQLKATTEQRDAAWTDRDAFRADLFHAREWRDKVLSDLRKALNMKEGGAGDIIAAISRLRDNYDRSQELAAVRLNTVVECQRRLNLMKSAMGLAGDKRHEDVLAEVQRLVTSAKRSEAISADRLERIADMERQRNWAKDHLQKLRGRLHETLGVVMDGNDDEALFARLNTILGEHSKVQGASVDVAPRPDFKVGDRVVVTRKFGEEQNMWTLSNDIHIGFPTPAEYENYQQNKVTALWIPWVNAGAFTGAADAQTGEVRRIVKPDVAGASDICFVVGLHDIEGKSESDYFLAESLDLAPPDTRTLRDRIADRGLDVTELEADGRRKFKVGDRVVIAREASSEACPWRRMDDRYLGQQGTIERQDKNGDLMVRLELDGDFLWFLAASVDLVTPSA